MARQSLTPFSSGSLTRSFDPFFSLHRQINRLFEDALPDIGLSTSGDQGGQMIVPNIDVSETEKEVRICVEMPGVAEEDVDVTLNEGILTIRGQKKTERKEERENYYFTERSFGTFQRSIRLPYATKPENAQAEFTNGVLTITLPKEEIQEQSHRIQIQQKGKSPTSGQDAQSQAKQRH